MPIGAASGLGFLAHQVLFKGQQPTTHTLDVLYFIAKAALMD